MSTNKINPLRIINFFSIFIALVLWITFFFGFFSHGNYEDKDKFVNWYPTILTVPFYVVFSIIILLKVNSNKGILLFALFLSLVSQNFTLQVLKILYPSWVHGYLITISTALCSIVFIKSLQIFPRRITLQDIERVFPKNKLLSGYTKFTLQWYVWIIIPLTILVFGLFSNETSSNITWPIINSGIGITAWLSLFVNYRNSSISDQNKILWLLWALLTYVLVLIINTLVHSLYPVNYPLIQLIFRTINTVTFLLAMIMCLFFFDTFDTGIIIKRTIVDGSIFIIIILIYNTLEHYLLHWLSQELQVSDVLISSFLSGIFVLIFSPVHHRLMLFVEKKIKKNKVPNAEING